MCDIEGCKLVTYKNNKCILHSDDKNKNIKEFWQEIRKQVKKKNDLNELLEISINLKNIYFPNFEEKGLAESLSDNGDNFFYQNDKKEFNKIFKLENCTFFEEANFQHIKFKKGLSLENCIFENGLNLKNNIFPKKAKVRIQNCPKITNANFENTTFKDLADFYNSTFTGYINFKKTNFQDISVFTKVTFKEDVNFEYTTFEELAQFKETIFEKKLNLEDSIIKKEINFLNIKNYKDVLKSRNIENRETARIIKNSFEKQDNIIEANKFYALEMEKRKEELSKDIGKGKNIIEFLIFHIHSLSSNHSTNPLLVLFWILTISLFYSYSFDFLENQNLYVDCFEERYIKSWIYNFYSFKAFSNICSVLSIIFGIYLLSTLICSFKKIEFLSISTICLIFFYIFLTNDFYLSLVAKNFNPFSIMTKGKDLTFSMLIYKSTIAYLIYQFIISIRQNTRRK